MNSTTCDARNEARRWLMAGLAEDTDVDEAVDQDEASMLYGADDDDDDDDDDDEDEDEGDNEDDDKIGDESEKAEASPATDDAPPSR